MTVQHSPKKYCTKCGSALQPWSRFCGRCGSPVGPLSDIPPPSTGAVTIRSFRPYSYALGVLESVIGIALTAGAIIMLVVAIAHHLHWVSFLVGSLELAWGILMIVGAMLSFNRAGKYRGMHYALGASAIFTFILSVFVLDNSPSGIVLDALLLLLGGIGILVLSYIVHENPSFARQHNGKVTGPPQYARPPAYRPPVKGPARHRLRWLWLILPATMVLAGAAAVSIVLLLRSPIREYQVPVSGSYPEDITTGPDGNLWYTTMYGNSVGKITPSGKITEYDLPSPPATGANRIIPGPDGNLWFTEESRNKICRITTMGIVTEYLLPGTDREQWSTSGYNSPVDITAGPDGNLWYTVSGANTSDGYPGGNVIGKLNPSTGEVTEYPIPTPRSDPCGIVTGKDGVIWFTESEADKICRVSTDGQFVEYPIRVPSPGDIVVGPDGNLWFTGHNCIGRFDLKSKATARFTIPTSHPDSVMGIYPAGITAGPDGNLWFTCQEEGAIFRMTPNGKFTRYVVPGGPGESMNPQCITAGPSGTVWFTAMGIIGRVRCGVKK